MTREEAIETLRANYPDKCYESLRNAVDIAIEALKAEPVKHGGWLDVVERVDALGGYWVDVEHTECSECHVRALRDCYGQTAKSDYCPNCGARMNSEDNG